MGLGVQNLLGDVLIGLFPLFQVMFLQNVIFVFSDHSTFPPDQNLDRFCFFADINLQFDDL